MHEHHLIFPSLGLMIDLMITEWSRPWLVTSLVPLLEASSSSSSSGITFTISAVEVCGVYSISIMSITIKVKQKVIPLKLLLRPASVSEYMIYEYHSETGAMIDS